MPSFRIDYSHLAENFDQVRALSEEKKQLWLRLFREHLCLGGAAQVLDVGCGTGRFTGLMAKHSAARVVGLDPSPAMLARARAKHPGGIDWLEARAEAIPLDNGVFDVCLASQVVHHFQDVEHAFAEMYRVLRQGGKLGVRCSSHAQLHTILDYRFFPSALQIDLKRLPDISVIRDFMLATGLAIEELVVQQPFCNTAEDYICKLASRYSSVLYMISQEEYERGLAYAQQYFYGRILDADERVAEITLLVGTK